MWRNADSGYNNCFKREFYFKTVHTVSPPVRSRLVVIIMVKSHCEATDENALDRIRIEKTCKYYDEDRDIKNDVKKKTDNSSLDR